MEDDVGRALSVRTASTVDVAASLGELDRSWGSEAHPLAGGWLILLGVGLYVNRALSAGVDSILTPADAASLITLSEAVGVAPAIEVTPSTRSETVRRLRADGFAHDPSRDVTLLIKRIAKPMADGLPKRPAAVTVRPVRSDADLRLWQETSAAGWGHTTPATRRASDAFAGSVNALATEHLVVALDSLDGRPVGCASTTERSGVAILGGMSTLPAERRRGVQGALLRYRLDHAARAGCDLAVTTTAPGSASERNLRRHGFTPRITIRTYTLALSPPG